MFNHAKRAMPPWLDRIVRAAFVVTPDMHRVHHSINRAETNSNFGFNLPWWDRLFGTYRAGAAGGAFGDDDRASPSSAIRRSYGSIRLLTQPFRDDDAKT